MIDDFTIPTPRFDLTEYNQFEKYAPDEYEKPRKSIKNMSNHMKPNRITNGAVRPSSNQVC